MGLIDQVNGDIKEAMKAKEKEKLEALRAVKSAFLLAATEKGAGGGVDDDTAMKVIQKLVKQRKESAELYVQQGRQDLADVEIAQADVISVYLPAQLSESELEDKLRAIIDQVGASSMADMGKVMGVATKSLAGQADGKAISAVVRQLLA